MSRKLVKFPKPNRDKLIEDHMHLVEMIAWKVKEKLPPSFEVDDLISEGFIGLIKAADTWVESLGPFEARARYKIRMAILDSVRRTRYQANTMASLDQPVAGEDGGTSDVSLLDLLVSKDASSKPAAEEENDRIASIDMDRQQAMVRKAVEAIPPRPRRVMQIYYFEQEDMTVAAEELGVQSSRASQIHQEGLRELTRELSKQGVVIQYETLRQRSKVA